MDSKKALKDLLEAQRARIDPTEIGWPPRSGRGRTARGLSQAQVAQLLYKTERWYGEFERGNLSSPAPEMLDAVARVLRMSEHQRSALYHYSLGYEPPVPADPRSADRVNPAWQRAVDAVTGHAAYLTDTAWNLLACNDMFVRMFPRAPGAQPRVPERNMMRYMLLNPQARELMLLSWKEQWAEPVTGAFRAALAAHPGNADLQQLEADVMADPEAGAVYRRGGVAHIHPDGDRRALRHWAYPGEPAGHVTMCMARPYGSPGARFTILVFDPGP
ncbi:helix-turn-helix domain-containing protein [Streptomyces sp. NPDC053079]|uniref:helix-turn-helix domain-containing protein n=1 Tax=Streptomyces sp. NPDC053079 TaxID=3365697 RepID=UPI0037D0B777